MDGEGVAAILNAADSGWALAALFLAGSFWLLNKFGNDIIHLLKENTRVTREAHDEAKSISSAIVTNHGSKNLGDAIDRLTGEVWAIRDRQNAMQVQVSLHLENCSQTEGSNHEHVTERLPGVELRLGEAAPVGPA